MDLTLLPQLCLLKIINYTNNIYLFHEYLVKNATNGDYLIMTLSWMWKTKEVKERLWLYNCGLIGDYYIRIGSDSLHVEYNKLIINEHIIHGEWWHDWNPINITKTFFTRLKTEFTQMEETYGTTFYDIYETFINKKYYNLNYINKVALAIFKVKDYRNVFQNEDDIKELNEKFYDCYLKYYKEFDAGVKSNEDRKYLYIDKVITKEYIVDMMEHFN